MLLPRGLRVLSPSSDDCVWQANPCSPHPFAPPLFGCGAVPAVAASTPPAARTVSAFACSPKISSPGAAETTPPFTFGSADKATSAALQLPAMFAALWLLTILVHVAFTNSAQNKVNKKRGGVNLDDAGGAQNDLVARLLEQGQTGTAGATRQELYESKFPGIASMA